MCGTRQKNATNFVRRVLIRNVPHFMVCLWIYAAALFAKCATIWQNVPHFHRKNAAILGKVLQSLDCGTLQDGALPGLASKCGAHRGISTAHCTPR